MTRKQQKQWFWRLFFLIDVPFFLWLIGIPVWVAFVIFMVIAGMIDFK